MRTITNHIGRILLIALILYCFGQCLYYVDKVSIEDETYMVYQKNAPINGKTAKQMQKTENKEENPTSFTLWGQEKNIDIENPELSRRTQVSLLTICGNSANLLKSSGYLDQDDIDGCLISRNAAKEIFGSANVVGKTISCKGTRYIIRGILKEGGNVVMIQASSTTGAVLNTASIRIPEGRLASSIANTFQSRHGFGESEVSLYTFVRWAKAAGLLIPLLIGIYLVFSLLRRIWEKQEYPVVFFGGLAALAGLTVFYIWIMNIKFEISQDFMPTRWSDFDFWTRLAEQKKSELLMLFQIEKREPEQLVIEPFMQILKYSLSGSFLFLVFRKKLMLEKLNHVYVYCLISIVIAYGCLWLQGQNETLFTRSTALWLLMPFWLLGCYVMQHKSLVKNG